MQTDNTSAIALKPSLLRDAIKCAIDANLPVFTWGPPGVGKSQIHAQVAMELFGSTGPESFIDMRAVLLDAVDLRGLPHINGDGCAHWASPSFLPTDGEGLLFIDELPQAPGLVQNALSSLILDRRLGEYQLPDGWRIAAAGNRETDRAQTVRMPSHIANRFLHLEFAIDNRDWTLHASTSGFRPEVIAFMQLRPELLHQFDPKSGEKAFPTPRAWEGVSNVLDASPSKDIEMSMYAGKVGVAAAAEFAGFMRVYRSLPNPDAVIMDPDNAALPDDPATKWALCGALARKADDTNFERVFKYLDRLPDEYTAFGMLSCIRRTPDLQTTKTFIDFGAKYAGVII